MFRHLKLLNYFKEMNLSPEETLTLIRRLETDSCRAEDYEVLMRVVRAHTDSVGGLLGSLPWRSAVFASAAGWTPATGCQVHSPPSPRGKPGIDTACGVRYFLSSYPVESQPNLSLSRWAVR